MESIISSVLGQLGGDTLGRISDVIGADRRTTERAVGTAVPVLVSALARNASSTSGAQSLLGALDRDHDGSVLDDLGSFIASFQHGPGGGILGHVLGDRQGAVESGLASATGLGRDGVSKLLVMLAPLVMGVLGRARQRQGLDADSLAGVLQDERLRATSSGPASGLLGQLLDSDGDGDVMDDVAKLGGGLLGALFGRNKR